MARGEFHTARIERIAAGGAGIARLEGKSVFLEMTADGDLARFRIRKDHRNWAEGELLEILEPSPRRITPVCPSYGLCGGCSLQHLSYEAQIDAKSAILADSFFRIAHTTPPEIRLRRGKPFEYRNRVRFHGVDDNRPGFKGKKSSHLVAVSDCPIADCGIRDALKEGALVPLPGKERFTVFSYKNLFLCEGRTGQGRVPILGRELAMDAGVFFQSNAVMLEMLISDLLAAASGADRELPLADVYCGVGTFASFLGAGYAGSRGFPEIDLVEENPAALALARENMPAGKKVDFMAMGVSQWIAAVRNRIWGFMVLDPPRRGLTSALSGYLAHNGPGLLAYVSCDPATLARDSRILLDGVYTLEELTMYDFYPQTAHIESLAIFRRRD